MHSREGGGDDASEKAKRGQATSRMHKANLDSSRKHNAEQPAMVNGECRGAWSLQYTTLAFVWQKRIEWRLLRQTGCSNVERMASCSQSALHPPASACHGRLG